MRPAPRFLLGRWRAASRAHGWRELFSTRSALHATARVNAVRAFCPFRWHSRADFKEVRGAQGERVWIPVSCRAIARALPRA